MILKDVLARRKLAAAAVFLVLIAATLVKAFFFSTFQAQSLLIVEAKKGPTTVETNALDPSQFLSLVRVHSHLMQSDLILKKVVTELELYREDDSVFGGKPRTGALSERAKEKAVQEAMASLRRSKLAISSPPFTNLIEVRVRHKNAETAAAIVNSLVKNYLLWNVGFQHEEADRLLEYLESETAAVGGHLEETELRLRDFKDENQITDLSEEIKAYFQILPERYKSHYELIQAGEVKLLDLTVERNRLRELYAEQSPQITYLGDTIDEVKRQLDGKLTQKELEDGFLKTLKHTPEKEMMLARLTREIKIQESLYVFLLDEKAKARLLKAKQNVEGVKVVSFADVPLKPSGRMKTLLLGAIASFLFTMLAIVVMEAGKAISR